MVKYDLSSVMQLSCGAAPLSSDIARLAEGRVGGGREKINLKQGWGMTEYVALLPLIVWSRYITLNELTTDDCGGVKSYLLGYRLPSDGQG